MSAERKPFWCRLTFHRWRGIGADAVCTRGCGTKPGVGGTDAFGGIA